MLIKEGWRCRLDGWRQTEQSQPVARTVFPQQRQNGWPALLRFHLLRGRFIMYKTEEIYLLTYGKHLWALEDLKLKKHNYILLKLLNGDFILEKSIFQLKAVTLALYTVVSCPVRYEFQNRLFAVGLSHRRSISWQSPVFKDITHALER